MSIYSISALAQGEQWGHGHIFAWISMRKESVRGRQLFITNKVDKSKCEDPAARATVSPLWLATSMQMMPGKKREWSSVVCNWKEWIFIRRRSHHGLVVFFLLGPLAGNWTGITCQTRGWGLAPQSSRPPLWKPVWSSLGGFSIKTPYFSVFIYSEPIICPAICRGT